MMELEKIGGFIKKYFNYIIIILIIIALYYRSFFHSFIQDDFVLLELVKNNFDIYKFFILDYFVPNQVLFTYRPLAICMYYASYLCFGLNPVGYHVIIMIIFFINSLVIYHIAKILTKNSTISLLTSIIYATRGALFFDIYWIAAGFVDLYVEMFIVTAILLYLLYREKNNKSFFALSIISSLLAITTKESAIVIPALILLMELYINGDIIKNLKNITINLIPYIIVIMLPLMRLLIIRPMISSGAYKMAFTIPVLINNLMFYFNNSFNNRYELVILLIFLCIALLYKKYWKATLIAAAWYMASLAPFIFLESHLYNYYISVAVVGFSLIASIGVSYVYDNYIKNVYIKYLLIAAFIIILMVSAQINIGSQTNLSAITVQENTSNNILSYLKNNYPGFPDGSIIYIKNSDFRTYAALGYGGSAIRLFYPDVDVYFDGITSGVPQNFSKIYYFNNMADTLYFVETSNMIKKDNLIFINGWYDWESSQGNQTSWTAIRWISNNATILINSTDNKNETLSFEVQSIRAPRLLQVYANDQLVYEKTINQSFMQSDIHLNLQPGENIIRFYTPEGTIRPSDIPELNSPQDTRDLSLLFRFKSENLQVFNQAM